MPYNIQNENGPKIPEISEIVKNTIQIVDRISGVKNRKKYGQIGRVGRSAVRGNFTPKFCVLRYLLVIGKVGGLCARNPDNYTICYLCGRWLS